MLPTTLVTITSFLIKLYSASPVYNLHPEFITPPGGMANGRNIRNLPCISRKSNNQMGVCMFAIDCLKSNGTHLGTCVDRFYFGSCCLITNTHEILDNRIETDVLDHREPPMRISNTTTKPSMNTEKIESNSLDNVSHQMNNIPSSTEIYIVNTTDSIDYEKSKTTQKQETSVILNSTKIPTFVNNVTFSDEKLTTLKTSTQPTVFSQKPQKVEITTEASTSFTKTSTTSRTTTTTQKKPTGTKPQKWSSSKSTPKPSKPTGTTLKPNRNTKVPTTTPPRKPSKTTTKPSQLLTTTRKSQLTTRKSTTSNHSPSINSVVATTQRLPVTTRPSQTSSSTLSTALPSTLSHPVTSSTGVNIDNNKFTPEQLTTEKTDKTTIKPTFNTTTTLLSNSSAINSNNMISNKINISEVLEQVNGNLATNEIEISNPNQLMPGEAGKPAVVTLSPMHEENYTSPSTMTSIIYNHTEAWIPVTTPDSWVLLPSVFPNFPNMTGGTFTSSEETLPPIHTSATPTTNSNIVANDSAIPLPPTSTYTPDLIITTEKQHIASTSTSPMVESVTVFNSSVNSNEKPVNMSDFNDVCGRRMYPEARIVGGEKSAFGRWPWQISLRQWRTSTYLHKCGAALLNENWAITAAHCVDHVPPSDLLLRLGEHDLSIEDEPYIHQERRVQIVASHPQFDPRTFEYDLALLRFYEPVVFQPNILPVCVPQTDENFVGRTAYVTGWGRLYEDGPLPSILQEVSVPVINNTVCESMYRTAGYIEHIPHIFICAGWRKGGFDSCEGDSGGPMVIQRDDRRFLLAGVISWGIGCAEPNQPGVYTRISEFREWINQILQF